MEEYCMRCKKCEYGKIAEKYWNKKIKKGKKFIYKIKDWSEENGRNGK